MMKKYIVLTLLFSLVSMNISVQAMQSRFTSSSDGNAAILAFFDQRAHERANPQRIVFAPADAAELAAIAAGHLQICPGCNRRAHRIEGCNHMTCSTNEGGCGTHYCYPCGTRYNPAINGGIGWEARACACPHFPDWAPEPIPVPDGRGGALPQANPMGLIYLADPMGLIYAARHGNLEIVLALINAGADVRMADESGTTALHNAAGQGHLEVVHALLAAGIQVDTPDRNGMTALQSAAMQGSLQVVEVLIAAGADVNRVTFEFDGGNTVLHYAVLNGNAVPPEDAPLVVNVLLAAGADVNATTPAGRTALDYAAEDGHLRAVQALLGARDIQVNTADQSGMTALHYAASRGYALDYAGEDGPLRVVEALLGARDIQVNTADQSGMTALHYAASRGYAEVVHALITAGADLKKQTNDGWTALHYPAEEGYLEVVQALLAAGIQVDTADENGMTALQLATRNGHAAVVGAIQQHMDRHK